MMTPRAALRRSSKLGKSVSVRNASIVMRALSTSFCCSVALLRSDVAAGLAASATAGGIADKTLNATPAAKRRDNVRVGRTAIKTSVLCGGTDVAAPEASAIDAITCSARRVMAGED